METKFQVGQVWKTRGGELETVCQIMGVRDGDGTTIHFPVWTNESHSHDKYGFYYGPHREDKLDLIELVTNADGTPANPVPLEATHELLTACLDVMPGELKAFEPASRQKFVQDLINAATVNAIQNGITFKDVADSVREAVTLRDELLKAA